MSRFHSYINSATTIIREYRGAEPLAIFLKQFFAKNKKFGSKDRKQVSALCYHYFRIGKALLSGSLEEGLLLATFLCEQEPSDLLLALRREWNSQVSNAIADKFRLVEHSFDPGLLFPFSDKLSVGIDPETFALSFLDQPRLFLRSRPGFAEVTGARLKAAAILFTKPGPDCFAIPNGSPVLEEILIDKEVVIQDYSSQQVGRLLQPNLLQTDRPDVWDCCAASGGKSILAFDLNPRIRLTVSDIRPTILHNLRNRFLRAGITNYHSFVADLGTNPTGDRKENYDLIIADVPCTGSGTWARTPEQLYYFEFPSIDVYVQRQRAILTNVVKSLKAGAVLVYITCSVFAAENEMQVTFLRDQLGLELVNQQLLTGYQFHADTMFVAVLRRGSPAL